MNKFFYKDYQTFHNEVKQRNSEWWKKRGEERALVIFHEAAKRVPAYHKFLKEYHINIDKIQTYDDYKKIPLTDKKNYIDKYPLEELIWDGKLNQNFLINSSSGTTGKPYFWPLSFDQIHQGAIIHEFLYKENFQIDKYKTLLIICFGMGTWIAGSYTLFSSQLVAQRGCPLTIITPGFNKEEALRGLKMLSPNFEQTIIAGIPTFIKDLIDDLTAEKEFKTIKKIKFLFAGESFSENWRAYILKMVKSANYFNDAVNILGSAEGAVMAFETPFTIMLRKMTTESQNLRLALFNDERVPSLEQYIPSMRFFEVENNELILTADRSLPLVRYNIHDQGGILSPSQVRAILKKQGFDLDKQLEKYCLKNTYLDLPLIYVFGRGKFTATIYAANIYPENVREVLIDKRISSYLTGRFTLQTKHRTNQDHYLQLNVELADHIKKEKRFVQLIANIFINKVRRVNSEYNKIFQEYGLKAKPKVVLYEYGDRTVFPKEKLKKTS